MTDDEWDTIALLLHRGFKWREPFAAAHERAYRTLLDGHTPEQLATALRQLVAAGQVFGPTPGELVQLIRADPGRPTFDEAWQLIRLVLTTRTTVRKAVWNIGERDQLNEQAMRDRAQQDDIHPLIPSFIERQGGPMRLRALALDDPENDYRELRRRELAERWAEHCDVMEGREIAALAAGGRTGHELARLDPLAALGVRTGRQLAAAQNQPQETR